MTVSPPITADLGVWLAGTGHAAVVAAAAAQLQPAQLARQLPAVELELLQIFFNVNNSIIIVLQDAPPTPQ